MNKPPLQGLFPELGSIVYGCMGLGKNSSESTSEGRNRANSAIDTALDCGIQLFDHADIYGRGAAEGVFGSILRERPSLRDEIYLQSKCGIRFEDQYGPKRYDFSAAWVTSSVEASLSRLQTDYLDVLLLHRPDPLLELEELAATLLKLLASGKVNHIGVSNMHVYQIDALQRALEVPIVVNQMEMSLNARDWLEEGVMAGNSQGRDFNFGFGMLDFCQEHNIQLQAWGCLAQGIYSGASGVAELKVCALVNELAEAHSCSPEAIVLAWLLRHPAGIQAVIGSTNPQRIKACCESRNVELSREQWYSLWVTARGHELP